MAYSLHELIDFQKDRHLLDSFCESAGIAAAIIDLEGKVLVASRWQRVCTEFHRVHPTTFERCVESDTRLAMAVQRGDRFTVYQCRNGLTDAASPIVIEGRHLANVFVGQFFASPPDLEFFRAQARAFGFDEEAYLAAVAEVPLVSEQKLPAILGFLCGFAERVASTGLERLRQMEMQEALRTSEQRFRMLLENIRNVAVQGYRADGTITFWNKANEMIYGYTAEEALGQDLVELLCPPEARAGERQIMAEALRTGRVPASGELLVTRKDGRQVPILTSRVLHQVPGQPPEFFCFDVDLTERKRGEEERARLLEQLWHSQKMEALGTLAGGVAHDFNNLLTVILGNVELIEGLLPAGTAARSYVDTVREAGHQAAGLTRSLLTFSRKVPTEKRPINLCAVVDKTARMLGRVLPSSVALVVETGCEPPPWIHGDETQMQQVVMNLAINARDAMPSGGTLRITVSRDRVAGGEAADGEGAWEAVLVISDTGSGMPPEVQSRLFEPFFTTKARGQGTGLGLAVIHGIVQEHGGRIGVESRVGRGSTFTVRLPCMGEAAAAGEAPERGAVTCESGHGTVLLAEDNPLVSSVIRTALELSGFEVIQVGDGPSLLAAAERHREEVKLLIVDADIPGRSGLACLKDLRDRGHGTAALVITGSVVPEVVEGLGAATSLLRKPFQVSVLRQIASELIGGRCGRGAESRS